MSHHHSFTVGRDSVIKMWDTIEKRLVAVKGCEEPVVSIDFVAEYSRLAVGAEDGTLILFDIRWKNSDEGSVPGHWAFEEMSREKAKGNVTVVRFSGDVLGERFLGVGRTDGRIDFFKVQEHFEHVGTSKVEGEDTLHAAVILSLISALPYMFLLLV